MQKGLRRGFADLAKNSRVEFQRIVQNLEDASSSMRARMACELNLELLALEFRGIKPTAESMQLHAGLLSQIINSASKLFGWDSEDSLRPMIRIGQITQTVQLLDNSTNVAVSQIPPQLSQVTGNTIVDV